ncbi:hypothetical protein PAAG_12102 [Paracoccidioides lutzii Pb01]|uniref:Uncharacterized protein n=1 Tax=Paracoccidioides lutzii (strain ATCC MYA-826 / Pb01) TaxID=502779 RepID=A0A0A2V187_PARBA|nr:hypothetical protein PAAG_12102 [Paracoccidioides lutzii Pb01]KGQ01243.1 hypothetical protein PAAG_12102 [Paracoccidioides lutzii Pb01]
MAISRSHPLFVTTLCHGLAHRPKVEFRMPWRSFLHVTRWRGSIWARFKPIVRTSLDFDWPIFVVFRTPKQRIGDKKHSTPNTSISPLFLNRALLAAKTAKYLPTALAALIANV